MALPGEQICLFNKWPEYSKAAGHYNFRNRTESVPGHRHFDTYA